MSILNLSRTPGVLAFSPVTTGGAADGFSSLDKELF